MRYFGSESVAARASGVTPDSSRKVLRSIGFRDSPSNYPSPDRTGASRPELALAKQGARAYRGNHGYESETKPPVRFGGGHGRRVARRTVTIHGCGGPPGPAHLHAHRRP